jgi:nucleotide-binding universal stress UspA family protein
MFRSILVPIDGSAHAEAALTQAIELVRSEGARLTVLCAWQPYPWYGGESMPVVDVEQLDADIEAEAHRTVQNALDCVPAGIASRAEVVCEHPADAILQAVEREGHDLVVLGSRGWGGLRSIFLGSVSQSVLHRCRVPVMIVHAAGAGSERRTEERPAALPRQRA